MPARPSSNGLRETSPSIARPNAVCSERWIESVRRLLRHERVRLDELVRSAVEQVELEALRRADGGALLVVADEGPGVPPEHHEAVFDPFWQGPTASTHRPGTGIGLSLVAAFTELHRGRYSVKAGPGGGAEFHVWVPLEHETSGDHP